MLCKIIACKAMKAGQRVSLKPRSGTILLRFLSDSSTEVPYAATPYEMGYGESTPNSTKGTIGRPNLPGLSDDQIRKIGEMDTANRENHIKIEGDMTFEERDVARVSFL
jgi:hypothetical protein